MAITSAIIIGITSALTTYALCLKHNILHIWPVLTHLTYIVNTIIPSYNKIIDINIFPYKFGLPVLQGKHFLSDLRKLTAVSESLSSSLRKYSVLRENHYYMSNDVFLLETHMVWLFGKWQTQRYQTESLFHSSKIVHWTWTHDSQNRPNSPEFIRGNCFCGLIY